MKRFPHSFDRAAGAPVAAACALFAALLSAALPVQAAPDATQALQRADQMRGGGGPGLQLETEVVLQDAAGKAEKTRLYTVYAKDPLNSVVVMRSPAEAGQKVLMSGDDFWLVLPGSQRPMRITPAQKLLGDASTGDIASLSWSQSYSAQHAGDEECTDAVNKTRRCTRLALQATRKGVSYARIDLWVGPKGEPLKADYYVQSDKLAKRAVFVLDDAEAPKRVEQIRLQDELAGGKVTVVRYTARKTRSLPEEWFNPMYLARTLALE